MSEKKIDLNLTKAFIKGLKDYNLKMEDIVDDKWKYCGGRRGCHLNYFKIACPGKMLPAIVDHCICGHFIIENCYITDGATIIPLGNCCIKKFIPKSTRTCGTCQKPHKNRKDNLCKSCRWKKANAKDEPLRQKIEIKVSYHDRQLVKDFGCMWNPQEKHWYMPVTIAKEDIAGLMKLKKKGIIVLVNK